MKNNLTSFIISKFPCYLDEHLISYLAWLSMFAYEGDNY